MSIKICATGDSIMMEAFPAEYDALPVISDFISAADLRINNLEMVLSEYDCHASTFCGGTWLTSETSNLDELCMFNFNYFSFANNHTMDYSYGGLVSTLDALDARGLSHSGAGMDLESASRHATVETKKGKAGIIAITATCDDAARAGNPGPVIPARPGLNMLRHSEIYQISEIHMQAVKEIAAATKINGRIDNSKKGGYTLSQPGVFQLGSLLFALNQNEGKRTIPNPVDMERMHNAIINARKEVDYVIVCFHSHEIPGLTDDEPDYFIEEFARACVDWGASAVIGSGTHQLKGIEIYKGKPIFYSIANFIFQVDHIHQLPADYYEKYGLSLDMTAEEALAVRSCNGKRGLQTDFRNYRAIIPMMEFEGETLIKLILKPIELGFERSFALKGLPHEADEAAANEIFSRLSRLSEPYKTEMHMEDGLIHITL
ncbi:MAG: CapA family protein [Clostridiaceae bacterium]|nr:CapA family protein [Clostridiaceae bacterium]